MVTTLDVLFYAFPRGPKELIWRVVSIAQVWSIWKMRNRVIFNCISFDEEGCFDMCCFNLASWIKAERGEQVTYVADIICNPGCIEEPEKPQKSRITWVRNETTCLGSLNNLYGSFLGASRQGGIGRGVFKDSEGKFLLKFCKDMTADSTVHAKVLALWEGLLLAVALHWASSHSFLFELDSKFVVVWIVDSSSAPWQYHNLLRKYCHAFGLGIRRPIIHISRTRNDASDVLARMSSKGLNFIEWKI